MSKAFNGSGLSVFDMFVIGLLSVIPVVIWVANIPFPFTAHFCFYILPIGKMQIQLSLECLSCPAAVLVVSNSPLYLSSVIVQLRESAQIKKFSRLTCAKQRNSGTVPSANLIMKINLFRHEKSLQTIVRFYGVLQFLIYSLFVILIEFDLTRDVLDNVDRWVYICPSVSTTAGVVTIAAYCLKCIDLQGISVVLNGLGFLCWFIALWIVSWITSEGSFITNSFFNYTFILIILEILATAFLDISLREKFEVRVRDKANFRNGIDLITSDTAPSSTSE